MRSLLTATTLCAPAAALQAQEVQVTDITITSGQTIPLNISLNNNSNEVTISNLPSDAVLSSGTKTGNDWIVQAVNVPGLTVTTNTPGAFTITVSQPTVTNEFNAASNGTFGTGSNPFGPSIGSATNFAFRPGSAGPGPGGYVVTNNTDAADPLQGDSAFSEGLFFTFRDRTNPGNGYFGFFDAQNVSAAPGNQVFFADNLTGLTGGTDYDFSFHAANIYSNYFFVTRGLPENVFPNFSIRFNGTEIATTGTLSGGMRNWQEFNATLTTAPGQTSGLFEVVMIADTSGASTGQTGADIVFDDFTLMRVSQDTGVLTVFAPLIADPDFARTARFR